MLQLAEPPHQSAGLNIGLVSIWPNGMVSGPQPGVATYTRILSGILASQGYRCTVLANADATPSGSAPGVTVVPTWNLNDPLSGRRIQAMLEKHDIDVLHLQHELFLYGSYASAFAFPIWLDSLATRVPTIVTVHGVFDPSDVTPNTLKGRLPRAVLPVARKGLSWIFQRIAVSRARKLVHSEALRDRLIRFGASPDQISVAALPSLLPIENRKQALTKADARRALNLPDSARVILTWGFDNSYKGFDVLVEGFASYRNAAADEKAVLIVGMGPHPKLAGSPSYMSDYGRRATGFRAVDGVRFAGFIPDDELSTYMAAADLAIFPYTQYIAASGPVSAALGFGMPVLFSRVFEDVPDVLRFEPQPSSIATALSQFFNDPGATLSASAQVAQSSSHDFVGSQYRHIYQSMSPSVPSANKQRRE